MNNIVFSEVPYYNAYKAIRNKIRIFDSAGLIEMCLNYLHRPLSSAEHYASRHPWCVLLLIKWVLIDDKFGDRDRLLPSFSQTVELIQKIINLAGKVQMPPAKESDRLFMRTIVFQQLLYQRRSTINMIGRQMVYFDGLAESEYIPQTFRKLTGLSLKRFLDLAMIFHAGFLGNMPARYHITTSWFVPDKLGGLDEVELFLSLFSDSLLGMRSNLVARDAITLRAGRMPRSASEYAEQSPLIRKPLLTSVQGGYVMIDPHLLENCLENFVYNTLRNYDVDRFMSNFGPLFERYVHLGVEYSGLPFRTEDELKLLLRKKQGRNLIDFLILDDDSHVFVDAKSAEMNYRGTVTQDPVELASLLNSSLLKAVQQANSVIADLVQINSEDLVFRPRERNYLIVVSYARTNIGNGLALAEAVGTSAIEEVVAAHPGGLQVPIENMYFLTIEEFDRLIPQIAAKNISLVGALERAKRLDRDPITARYMFEQHLEEWGLAHLEPEYLRKRRYDLSERISAL